MKKLTRRVLSVLLCIILVIGTVMPVSAKDAASDDNATETGSASNRVSAAVQNANLNSNVKRIASTGSITLTTMKTGEEDAGFDIVQYSISDPVLSGSYRGISQQVYLKKGTVVMAARAQSNTLSGSAYYGIFKDVALTQAVDSYSSVTANNSDVSSRVFRISEEGTYYLGVYSYISAYSEANRFTVGISGLFISGENRTLANGKKIAVGQKDSQTNYFKFTAVKTGYMTVQSSETLNKITLCNSKKKAISAYSYAKYNPTYGVTKGTTYYIKVESVSTYTDGGYTLQADNKAVSEKSGTKKAKAVTIKKGKTKKGTITAGSGQADWYKFQVTSEKKFKITVKGATNDRLKITVYNGSRNMGSGTFWYSDASRTWQSYGTLKKGTYYITISRANAQSSGWYSIKWK